ncbi:beta-glucosidase-like [Raphidocelis subcapitata]|uniref:beta-glucosidase n=1 Tax=Raphidocelis subcapitata TaxID=307507 RepID=A0A2V0NT13_9CHLO|nr:beta-glucosidase-like [Raphidocelis subcapitata]|eukprot:GBF90818.1 beta-glucosidase-like [Raphidocelis subcapitata]
MLLVDRRQGAQTKPAQLPAAAAEPLPPPAPGNCTPELRRRIGWGVATAAYQVEGGWDEGGRSPSVWDVFAHKPGTTAGGATGDVACDMYHKYEEDFELMARLGIRHYRLSLSWSRLLPQGGAGTPVSPEGLAFYNRLIDAMLARGIEPYVTLYHWDLPQVLQDAYGGFLDGARFVPDFAYYAAAAFEAFGGRVKNWITFNEPWVVCKLHYGDGTFAPGIPFGLAGQYACGHTLLLAHAAAAALYARQYYKPSQRGRLGVALSMTWHEPGSASEADARAAQNARDSEIGWFADPLFGGDYPESLRRTVGAALPAFSDAERAAFAAHPLDFLGINFYTARYAFSDGTPWGFAPSETDAAGAPIGPRAQSSWLLVVPWAFRRLLLYVSGRYGGPEVFVTENGVSVPGEAGVADPAAAARDAFRTDFYRGYLDSLCTAVAEGANVTRYFAWSFMDNFEWRMGYTERFGIVAVNFTDPARPRTVKDSARYLAQHFFRAGA